MVISNMRYENQEYPPVDRYLSREPLDLFNREFEIYPRLVSAATFFMSKTMASCEIDEVGLQRLRELDGQPVVLAPTHEGISDIPIISMIALRGGLGAIRMISKVENMDTRPKSWLLRHLGAFPVDRDGNYNWMKSLLEKTDYILNIEKRTLGIFPQGTRGATEALPGTLAIASRANVPYVPIGIHGTSDDFRNLKKGKRPHVAVAIGEPRKVVNRKDTARLTEELHVEKKRAIEMLNR